ncbi:hypothetical protein D3C72_1979510 [compost metagenome]
MAHTFTWRSCNSANEANHWLLHVLLNPFSSFFFRGPANFTDHNYSVSVLILIKATQNVNKFRALYRVAADTDS